MRGKKITGRDRAEKDPSIPRVLVLNASLKHTGKLSNTGELASLVLKFMKEENKKTKSEIIRLADIHIPPGVGFRESKGDKWPEIAQKIVSADIIIFATPIWWGARSSLMQRIIERMDTFDEQNIAEGRSALLNKIAGVVITGSEDGAQSTLGSILSVLTFMNFTIPPECCTYWVGEVGPPHDKDREKRLKNSSSEKMAKKMAHNLLYYSSLLKRFPMETMKT
jgi:multimeric flavodoxin WrbA